MECLESCATVRHFPKDALLIKKGQHCHDIYFIETGFARIFSRSEEKEITTLFAMAKSNVLKANIAPCRFYQKANVRKERGDDVSSAHSINGHTDKGRFSFEVVSCFLVRNEEQEIQNGVSFG